MDRGAKHRSPEGSSGHTRRGWPASSPRQDAASSLDPRAPWRSRARQSAARSSGRSPSPLHDLAPAARRRRHRACDGPRARTRREPTRTDESRRRAPGRAGSGAHGAHEDRRAGRKRREGRYTPADVSLTSLQRANGGAPRDVPGAAAEDRRRRRRARARRARRERRQADRPAAARARRGRRGRRGLRRPPADARRRGARGSTTRTRATSRSASSSPWTTAGPGRTSPRKKASTSGRSTRGSRTPTRARGCPMRPWSRTTPSRTISTITAGRTATTAARKGRERIRRTTWTRGAASARRGPGRRLRGRRSARRAARSPGRPGPRLGCAALGRRRGRRRRRPVQHARGGRRLRRRGQRRRRARAGERARRAIGRPLAPRGAGGRRTRDRARRRRGGAVRAPRRHRHVGVLDRAVGQRDPHRHAPRQPAAERRPGKSASPLGAWGAGGAPVTLATTPGRLWVLAGKTLWSPAAGAVVPPPETGLPRRRARPAATARRRRRRARSPRRPGPRCGTACSG